MPESDRECQKRPESARDCQRMPERARKCLKVPIAAAAEAEKYQRVPNTPRMDPENSWVINFHPEFLRGGNRQEEEIIVL